jgi:hypothetical protein
MGRHKLTFVTPTNNDKYIYELYNSLLEQNDKEWEWIIVLNGDIGNLNLNDYRIKQIRFPFPIKNKIGALKKFGFDQVKTEIGVELDHDDLLTSNAVEEIKKAFLDEDIGFVYSDFAEFQDKTWKPNTYSEQYGWMYKDFSYKGHTLKVANQFELFPSTLGWIYFAPNHIRCWKMNIYKEIGGHDSDMEVGDDHDLVCRTYLKTKFNKIT